MSLESVVASMQERASSVSPIGNTLKFALGEQVIYIDGTGDTNTISQEDKDADCTIKMSADDMQDLIGGKLNPMMAFMSGKIKVDGDMGVAMKLQSLLG